MSATTHCDLSRPRGLCRGVSVLAAACLVVATGSVLAAPAHGASAVRATQPMVILLHDHVARARPSVRARKIETIAGRRPLTAVRTVLPVLGPAVRKHGSVWLEVRLPGRPNAHKGWIRTDKTRRTATGWQLTLDLSTRIVRVYRDGRVDRKFRAVIGTPWTPTPRGRFFIEEALAIPGQHGGPFALATSARSDVLQEFEGGPGQIALHGTEGLAGALGTASSHGCVRLSTPAITWLARHIGHGVPLTISR